MYKRINVVNDVTCLVVENPEYLGTNIIGYNCVGISDNQENALWEYNSSTKQIRSKYSNKSRCIGVGEADMIEGGSVIIWDCMDIPDQKWTIRSDGTIRNDNSLFCISLDNNNRAIQRDCNVATRFTF